MLYINGVEALINVKVGGTWSILSGTWTIPAVTLGGAVNLNNQNLTGFNYLLSRADANAVIDTPNGAFTFYIRCYRPAASAGIAFVISGLNASDVLVNRLNITSGVNTATATWSNITHTGLVITSGGLVEGAGTGANGFKIKNPKNAAASALSGVQRDIEIDIGGTPYYFTVYPTKA